MRISDWSSDVCSSDLLHERRIKIRDGKADLPKRRAELASAEADLRRLATELEWDADDVDQLIGRIPARAKVSTGRTLLNRRGERLSAVENAKTAAEEAAGKASDHQRQLAAQDAPAGSGRAAGRAGVCQYGSNWGG